MHFQHVLASRELQQITDMLYVRQIAGYIETDVYIFMLLYLEKHRDTDAEKEFDIVIQMTLEHILVRGFKKKEMDKKHLTRLLTKTSRCYKASKFLKNNDLAKSLF